MATTTCDVCGRSCHGSKCRDCRREQRLDNTEFNHDDPTCPDCGGVTSGQGVTCYKCR